MGLKPLRGIKVLDLTNVLAGPFCCHQLAHLGADVIKIEAPERGDLARQLGADADLNARHMGVSFLAQNAGKRSVTLNLKAREGIKLLKRLVRGADVLVENFRPGVMDRLGVGWNDLKVENPELIYAAISGFGQDGPWRARPAYDQIIQGVSGMMSVTGTEESGPLRVGYPIGDTVGGLTAAMAICAALNGPERGAFIDVSMLAASLATMGWVVSNQLIAGVEPGRHGNENVTSAPSGAFQAADGLVNIAANRDGQWELLARYLGREDLLERPEFATREDRKENRHQLRAELEAELVRHPVEHWVDGLNGIGVPAGAVLDVPEILAHPVMEASGTLGNFENVDGVGRDVSVVRPGVRINGEPLSVSRPPPVLGQDTDTVLSGLGLSKAEIDRLRADGVI